MRIERNDRIHLEPAEGLGKSRTSKRTSSEKSEVRTTEKVGDQAGLLKQLRDLPKEDRSAKLDAVKQRVESGQYLTEKSAKATVDSLLNSVRGS